MANELRVRQNWLGGLVEDNPLASGATTLTSAALAAAVAIGTTQHMPITLDPDGLYGEPEIAYITAHTAAATTATLLRGQEGSTARAHNRDVPWVHGPTVKDVTGETAWTAPTLVSNATTLGGAFNPAGYMVDSAGWVHLRGAIKPTGSAIGVGTTLFTLPPGYRPENTHMGIGFGYDGSSYAGMRIDIQNTGAVVYQGIQTTLSLTNGYVSLDGIAFRQFQ